MFYAQRCMAQHVLSRGRLTTTFWENVTLVRVIKALLLADFLGIQDNGYRLHARIVTPPL
eukprot:6095771-Pyramimonas_sp.AAC.1